MLHHCCYVTLWSHIKPPVEAINERPLITQSTWTNLKIFKNFKRCQNTGWYFWDIIHLTHKTWVPSEQTAVCSLHVKVSLCGLQDVLTFGWTFHLQALHPFLLSTKILLTMTLISQTWVWLKNGCMLYSHTRSGSMFHVRGESSAVRNQSVVENCKIILVQCFQTD